MTSSDEYDITSNSSTTSHGGLHVTSLNIGVGGVICSPSSVTSDYHSSTVSTASTLYNSSLNSPPKTLARSSTASLATVYKSPHPPPVPPKPRSKQQSVARSNLSGAENRPSVNSRQERQKVALDAAVEQREHQSSVVTEDGEGGEEEEDRLSVSEGDVREADMHRIDGGMFDVFAKQTIP